MNNLLYKYIGLSPIFILIQIFILNEVLFGNIANPFLYVTLIITLPKNTPNWFILLFSFFLGFAIDLFSSSIGYHSTACVIIAFIKPLITQLIIPNNIIADQEEIQMHRLGIKSFIIYACLLIFIHHSVLFLIEYCSISILITLLFKIIISTIVTLVLICITQLLFYRKK